MTSDRLTDLDNQIADVERALAALPQRQHGALRLTLEREREQLIRAIERRTVGARGASEVL